jgi:hypothetical protein
VVPPPAAGGSPAQLAAGHPPEIVTIVLVEFALTWLCSYKVRGAGRPLPHSRPSRPPRVRPSLCNTCACWPRLQVLAWACIRGPLARPWRPLQFAAIMLAPITPVEGRSPA